MKVVLVYARLYAECFKKAFKGIRKNLWTLVLPVLLGFLSLMALALLNPLGVIGGILWLFFMDAVFSAYLYFVGETVGNSKTSLSEWKRSVGAYFWSIINVLFILWLVDLMLDYALKQNPNAHVIRTGIAILEFILLNPIPEVLYQRGTYGFASITESAKFVQEHWIEWLIPHAIIGALLWQTAPELVRILVVDTRSAIASMLVLSLPVAIIGGPLLHVFMVFRGHLFEALSSTSHRQRMYRFRAPT